MNWHKKVAEFSSNIAAMINFNEKKKQKKKTFWIAQFKLYQTPHGYSRL